MATSSITKDVVVSDKENADAVMMTNTAAVKNWDYEGFVGYEV